MKNPKITRIHVQVSRKEYYFENLLPLLVYFVILFLLVCFQIWFIKINIYNMNRVELKHLYVWLISFPFDIYLVSFIIFILKQKIICLNDILLKKDQISFVIQNKVYVLNEDNTILSMNKNGLFIKNPADKIELFLNNKIVRSLRSTNNDSHLLYKFVTKLKQ